MEKQNILAEEKEQTMSEVTCYRVGDKVVFRGTHEYIAGVIIGIATEPTGRYQGIEKRRQFKVEYGRIGRSMWVEENSLGGIISEKHFVLPSPISQSDTLFGERIGNKVGGKTICGCNEDGRPCAKTCGLPMDGWLCEDETGLRQIYPDKQSAIPVPTTPQSDTQGNMEGGQVAAATDEPSPKEREFCEWLMGINSDPEFVRKFTTLFIDACNERVAKGGYPIHASATAPPVVKAALLWELGEDGLPPWDKEYRQDISANRHIKFYVRKLRELIQHIQEGK